MRHKTELVRKERIVLEEELAKKKEKAKEKLEQAAGPYHALHPCYSHRAVPFALEWMLERGGS